VINTTASMAPIISVNHQCPSGYDIRPLQYALGNSLHRQSHAHAQSVLSSFSFSKFAAKVFPPASIDIGIGGRELSKLHDVVSLRANHSTSIRAEDRERLAVSEFTIWLTSRAAEIKSGGLLACHFAIRTYPLSDERTRSGDRAPSASPAVHSMSLPTSPRGSLDGASTPFTEASTFVSSPPLPSPPITDNEGRSFRPDLWRAMHHAFSPAIQRLVSLGEIRSHVAPLLVDIPFWPKTLNSVKSTLGRQQDWDVISDKSTPRPNPSSYRWEERLEWLQAGVRIHRLTHPAWTAYRYGIIDKGSYARRVATYCRSGESVR